MYFTREEQVAPEPIQASRSNSVQTSTSEVATSDYDRTIFRSPALSSRLNKGIRVVALSRAQQTHGNYFTQRLVSQIQLSSKDSAAETHASRRIPPDSTGEPLDEATRRLMEQRMGADFRDVRVHTDPSAAASAEALDANAYTAGRDIYFGAGKYAPGTEAGQHLLAHELTHTLQQADGATPIATSQVNGVAVSDASDPLETEAEQMATAVSDGGVGDRDRLDNARTQAGETSRNEPEPHPAAEPASSSHTIQRQPGSRPSTARALSVGALGMAYEGAVLLGKTRVYELKGSDEFEPDMFIQAWIFDSGGSALVNVRFGDLASGKLYVTDNGTEYSAAPTPLPVTHSELSASAAGGPSLIVQIGPGSKITGSLGITKPLPPNSIGAAYGSAEDHDRFLASLIGQSATTGKLENLVVMNQLAGGHLIFNYGFTNTFHRGTYLVGAVVMIDEAFAFAASLNASGKGIVPAKTDIKRDKRGDLIGNIALSTDWEAKGFKGTLALTYEDGVIEIRGSLKYDSPRVKGEVNVVATEESRAWQSVQSQLAAVQQGPKPMAGSGPSTTGPVAPGLEEGKGNVEESLAITAWGVLKIIITDKIEADAGFVVDPEGYLTVRGTVRAPHKITLMDAKELPEKVFYDDDFSDMEYVAPAVGIRAKVHIKFSGTATFGPLTLHDITITGLYSTRPDVNKELQISAKLNLSGSAKATLGVDGELALRLGTKYKYLGANPAALSLNTKAEAEVRGVVEAEPTIKIQESQAKGSTDKIPKYIIGGELFIGGEADIKLSGDFVFTLAGKDFWEIHLGDKVFPIAGFGLTTKVAYTIGSDEAPAVEVNKGAFEPMRFIRQAVQGNRPKQSGDPVKGGFKEGGKEKGHTIPSDVVPEAPPQPPKTQVVQFMMDGAVHTLYLTLGGPNEPVKLELASKREPAKAKISKAQKDLIDAKYDVQTDEAAKTKIDRRLNDLSQASRDATRVEQAATKLGAEPETSELNVPGLPELGSELQDYGDRYHVSDLADPTPGQAPPKAGTQPSAPTGKATKSTKPRGDGKDFDRIKNEGELLDLTDYMNPIGQQFPARSVPPDYISAADSKSRTNKERGKAGRTAFIPRKDKDKDDFVELHHTTQDFFSTLDETSHTFHQSVVDDPDYHPMAGDPGYQSWREWFGEYRGTIRRLGYIYNRIREKYWRRRF